LMVFVGPTGHDKKLSCAGESFAALALDEILMGDLVMAKDVPAFIKAVNTRLNNLTVLPHAQVQAICDPSTPTTEEQHAPEPKGHGHGNGHGHGEVYGPTGEALGGAQCGNNIIVQTMQKYSIPLVTGVLVALIWSNVDIELYNKFNDSPLWEDAEILGHTFSLHFIVNDIFMCFFFGLAIKEVTEALLPGGSLSPISCAMNPLIATVGGVIGPGAVYVLFILLFWVLGSFDGMTCVKAEGARRLGGGGGAVNGPIGPCELGTLIRGWGVPTATDISLAWMFALVIFGAGHPAINFLLLLAIVDDALGMVIIAVFYSDPMKPVQPVWLLLIFAAAIVTFFFRLLRLPRWGYYVFICGPVSWLGLLKANVHPALALVFVVPLMPANLNGGNGFMARLTRSFSRGSSHRSSRSSQERRERRALEIMEALRGAISHAKRSHTAQFVNRVLDRYGSDDAPLHMFEHTMKLPVDMGMFFFGLSNAGVKLSNFGALTLSVIGALIVGKTIGIAGFAWIAIKLKFPLPSGVRFGDLGAMGALGGVGLTVALFVANEAFVDPGLKGQAKFGAVLSVLAAGFAMAFQKITQLFRSKDGAAMEKHEIPRAINVVPIESEPTWVDDVLIEEILQAMWLQRRYRSRGANLPMTALTPTGSRPSSRGGSKDATTILVQPSST